MNAAHLDYDTLADLVEGLLNESKAASADAHLASCAVCRGRSAEIADVSRLLAEAPVPPMPAELAARIDEAIAAEAAAGPVVVSLQARRARKRLRVLSVAAAAVVVVGGGALVGRTLVNGSLSSDSQTAASKPVQDRTGRPGGGEGSAPNRLQGPAAADAYRTEQSGTDYTAARLDEQVSAQLAKPEQRARGSAGAPQEFAVNRQLSGCVQRVAQGKVPLLVDVARYEGRPATLVVLPGASVDRRDVWIVGPSCSTTDTALIHHAEISSL